MLVFSPSIDIDKTWEPVKKHQSDDMKAIEKDKDILYFNHYDTADLEHIIDTHHQIIKLMKASNRTMLFWLLMVIEDIADDAVFARQSKLMHSLYTRGRHNSVSTIASTQKFAAIHPIIRVNATRVTVYRLRNNQEVESFLEEVSGLSNKKNCYQFTKLRPRTSIVFFM